MNNIALYKMRLLSLNSKLKSPMTEVMKTYIWQLHTGSDDNTIFASESGQDSDTYNHTEDTKKTPEQQIEKLHQMNVPRVGGVIRDLSPRKSTCRRLSRCILIQNSCEAV